MKYNPFEGEVSARFEDYWGIVVVLEDSYIKRIHYFEKASDTLKIEKNTAEWNWLVNHIKVISLFEIERISLGGCSLIDACKESFGDSPFNYTFMGFPSGGSNFTSPGFLDFRRMLQEKMIQLIDEMYNYI